MRDTAIILAACLVAIGGLLVAGLAPAWLTRLTGAAPGGMETLGLAIAATGLFQLGRRRSHVRFVAD